MMKKYFLSLILVFAGIFAAQAQFNSFDSPTLPGLNMDYTMLIDTGNYAFSPETGGDDPWNDTRLYGRKEIDSTYTGFTISNWSDSTTPGRLNDRAAYPTIGQGGSHQYAIARGRDNFMSVDLYIGARPTWAAHVYYLYVANATIAALSMMHGDSTAKKFGGADGTDPDWLLLTIRGYVLDLNHRDSIVSMDSMQIYLADFRSADSTEDYILKGWEKVDLTAFGRIDSLSFHLSSSDMDSTSMKTPAYFCIDNIGIEFVGGIHANSRNTLDASVYPNPAKEVLNIKAITPVSFVVYNIAGTALITGKDKKSIDIKDLPHGTYLIKITEEKSERSSSFIFQKVD